MKILPMETVIQTQTRAVSLQTSHQLSTRMAKMLARSEQNAYLTATIILIPTLV